MRVWVEGEVGEGVKMGRKLRKAEGEIEMAERGILYFVGWTEYCCAVTECGETGSLERAGEEPVIILICVEYH